MKWIAAFRHDRFYPILFLSLTGHLLGLGLRLPYTPPIPYAVKEAPNSLEFYFIEEKQISLEKTPVPKPIFEDVFALKTDEAIVKIQNFKEEFVLRKKLSEEEILSKEDKKPVLLKEQEKSQISMSPESQGAILKEAKPLAEFNRSPAYPNIARRRGWQGIVFLKAHVSAQGITEDVQIERSSGYSILDKAAFNAIKTWQFLPAQRGTLKFESWITIPVEFKLVD